MCMVAFCEEHLDDEYISSTLVARSAGKNQVVVRRLIGMLRDAGLVECAPGSRGGVKIARSIESISLYDIYQAVESRETFGLHDLNERCPVARATASVLCNVFDEAEEAIREKIRGVSLLDLRDAADRDPEVLEKGREGLMAGLGLKQSN